MRCPMPDVVGTVIIAIETLQPGSTNFGSPNEIHADSKSLVDYATPYGSLSTKDYIIYDPRTGTDHPLTKSRLMEESAVRYARKLADESPEKSLDAVTR